MSTIADDIKRISDMSFNNGRRHERLQIMDIMKRLTYSNEQGAFIYSEDLLEYFQEDPIA